MEDDATNSWLDANHSTDEATKRNRARVSKPTDNSTCLNNKTTSVHWATKRTKHFVNDLSWVHIKYTDTCLALYHVQIDFCTFLRLTLLEKHQRTWLKFKFIFIINTNNLLTSDSIDLVHEILNVAVTCGETFWTYPFWEMESSLVSESRMVQMSALFWQIFTCAFAVCVLSALPRRAK